MRTGLKGIESGFLKDRKPPKDVVWKGLHEQLIRQSYIITLLYDVNRDQFGQGEETAVQDEEGDQKEDNL